MQRLRACANLVEAQLIVDQLAHARIPAQILNRYAQGGLGELPFTHTWPEVWLEDETDLARAQEVVRRYDSASTRETQVCRQCGEANPATFELCWHCGAAL